jgi:SAM-dependent methyltransferase
MEAGMSADLITAMRHSAHRIVPNTLWSYGSHTYYKRQLHRRLQRLYPDRCQRQEPGPVPPPRLITTEALMLASDLSTRSSADRYLSSGYRDALGIIAALARHGFDLPGLRSVAEFGCGTARVLRHFRNIRGLRLVGMDANPRPVEWCREKLSRIEFCNNRLEPPLDYPDGSFDVVYALSVFTHIPIAWQRAWIEELYRMLRPGGFLICTVLGVSDVEEMLSDEERAQMEQLGGLDIDADHPRVSYSSQVLGSWDVFQTRAQVAKSFGAVFELLEYTDRRVGQDMLVLRKPDHRLADCRTARLSAAH